MKSELSFGKPLQVTHDRQGILQLLELLVPSFHNNPDLPIHSRRAITNQNRTVVCMIFLRILYLHLLFPISVEIQVLVKPQVCHCPSRSKSIHRCPKYSKTVSVSTYLLAPHLSPSFPASISAIFPFFPSFLHSSRKFRVVMDPWLDQYSTKVPIVKSYGKAGPNNNKVVLDFSVVSCHRLVLILKR